ncbi:M48 family metalloprotease [Sphingomonas sp. So64.6b]|nr:M48 family metalloprotease [Sphingomonas sp. So64.6b]
MNGAADGIYAQVSSDLAALAETDDELAAVLAHELAHNILHHRLRLDGLSVSRGLLASFGRNARLIRQTEIEADRLSIYLLSRAGFDAEKGMVIWERLGRRASGLRDTTHPQWRERLRLMTVERDRLRRDGNIALAADLAAAVAAASR